MNKFLKGAVIGMTMLVLLGSMPLALAETTNTSTGVTTTVAQQAPVKFLRTLTVTAISGTTITGTNPKGVSYTVDASNAKILRKFGAQSSMDELSVGDKIRVYGTKTDKASTSVTASRIRNLSVHVFLGSVAGKVTALNSDGFTLSSGYVVKVSGDTKYHGTKTITVNGLSDLQVGDSVRAWGLKDTAAKTDKANSVRLLNRSGSSATTPAGTAGTTGAETTGTTTQQ